MSDAPFESTDVEQLRQGDPTAWETFYERIYPQMLAYAQRRLGYGESARDAVSEALARLVASITKGPGIKTTPEGWGFGILRHVVIDMQRKTHRERSSHEPLSVPDTDPSGPAELGAEHDDVRRAFRLLNDADRELLELRVVAGLSSEEVAEVLSMRPGAVRMAQARALGKLRTLLGEGGVG